uniref:Uncharacterized protein n=1 Tax=Rhizophora mucronata TaxID=61149 RepID=A0A2P2IZT6_RHIMU
MEIDSIFKLMGWLFTTPSLPIYSKFLYGYYWFAGKSKPIYIFVESFVTRCLVLLNLKRRCQGHIAGSLSNGFRRNIQNICFLLV